MDKKTLLGLLLIMAVLFGWTYFTQPSKEEKERMLQQQDSIAQILEQQRLEAAKLNDEVAREATIESPDSENNDTAITQEIVDYFGEFAPFAKGERAFTTLENDKIKLVFSNLGGRIYSAELKEYETYDSLPLMLFEGDSTEFGLSFFAQNRSINTNKLFFNVKNDVQTGAQSIVYTLNIADDKFVEFAYTLTEDSYVVDFDVNFKGMEHLIASNVGYINMFWKSYIPSLEKGRKWEQQNSSIFYKFLNDDVESLSMRSESDEESLTTKLKWMSFKNQFFNSTIIADNYFSNAIVSAENAIDNKHVKYAKAEISLPYDGKNEETIPMSFYFGPNHYKTLKKLDLGMEELVEMGGSIIRWVNVGLTVPLFNWLGKFIGNYGLIILIMTIIIKVIIFPFTYKSYMSTAKMKALKPEVDKVTAKFTKPEDAMKKQQATMDLYKKVGVSPMGGCLPMLFQMPILLALFRFFPNSIELRGQGFLWAHDLSTYDSVLSLPFEIPFYGDHVSLFALLMTIVNFIYMKTNDQMNAAGNQQMPGMKMMMYFMPVMMLFWLNSYAAALSYYYFVSLLITILQTWLIRRSINDEEILAKLKAAQANKKAPKKSKWQKRMEDMAKQRGMQMPKK